LLLIIALAIAQAVLRVVVVPPWQNNDEPGHMEHILYIVENRRLPDDEDIDYELRQRISDTYRQVNCSNDQPGRIRGCLNYHQFEEPPLYYVLQAGVQLLFNPTAIENQLRLARLVSVALFCVLVSACWHTVRMMFPDKPLAATIAGALVATLPSLVNTMSSVNNDAMAATAGSLLVLSSTILIARGFSLNRILGFVVTSLLVVASKPTAALLLPVALFGLWLAMSFRYRWTYLAPLVLLVVATFLALDAQGSAAWIKMQNSTLDRAPVSNAHTGQYVFTLNTEEAIGQYLSTSNVELLRGQEIKIAAWTRAGAGVIHVNDGLENRSFSYEASDKWTLFQETLTISPEAEFVEVKLEGADTIAAVIDDVEVVAINSNLENLLRNGSAESAWLMLRPQINALTSLELNLRLQSLYSWWYTRSQYFESINSIFLSFWGSFGWGGSMFQMPYTGLLAIISAVGIIGILIGGMRSYQEILTTNRRVRLLFFLLLYILAALLFTFVRTDPPMPIHSGFVTSARYFVPAVTPTIILLILGWYYILPERIHQACAALFIGLLFITHMISLFTIQYAYFLEYS